jgi:hypothetical protein
MTHKTAIFALVATLTVGSATASSPEAWQQMGGRVDRACLAASGLQQAKIATDKASFPDRMPIELRIVEGYNRQSVIDVMICAYDRRTRRVAVTPASGRLGVYRN